MPQKIEQTSRFLLQLQNIENTQSEIVLTPEGRIVTVENLNSTDQYLAVAEECKIDLQHELINLDIRYSDKITVSSLSPKLKDTIIAYYMGQGIPINEIEGFLENCDNNIELFKTLLETKLKNLYVNYKSHINLQKLKDYLKLHITRETKSELIFRKIKRLAIDDEFITLSSIVNTLVYDFGLTETSLQKGIIEALYGNETAFIFYEYKNNIELQQKQENEILKLKYEHLQKLQGKL